MIFLQSQNSWNSELSALAYVVPLNTATIYPSIQSQNSWNSEFGALAYIVPLFPAWRVPAQPGTFHYLSAVFVQPLFHPKVCPHQTLQVQHSALLWLFLQPKKHKITNVTSTTLHSITE